VDSGQRPLTREARRALPFSRALTKKSAVFTIFRTEKGGKVSPENSNSAALTEFQKGLFIKCKER
jgi:hypothetical protein